MKLDFSDLTAPEGLKAETIAKMERQARTKKPRVTKRIVACAAAFAAETFSEEAYLARLLPIYEQLTGKQ